MTGAVGPEAGADLRPRSASELVDGAFRLLRHHYGSFVLLSSAAYVPTLLIQLGQLDTTRDMAAGRPFTIPWALYLLAVPSYAFTESALTALASDAYHTGEAHVGDAVLRALRRFLPAVAAIVAVGVVVLAGLIALIVPGIYLLLRLYTTLAATVLEGAAPLAAARRTWGRTRGRVGHMGATVGLTFLMYFVFFVGASFVAGIAAAAGGAFGSVATQTILALAVQAVVSILVYPMVPIVSTLLYYDLRIRSEGYDLEVMSERLGGASLGAGLTT